MTSDYLNNINVAFNIKSFLTEYACLLCLEEAPDAVFLDYSLNLKEKDAASGIDILKEIEKRNKAILVIMLSSKKRYGTVTKIILYDAVHYVIKS